MASPRVWFITGCSSGFGRLATELALKKGDNVIATLRTPSALSDLQSHYPADRLLVLRLDVTLPAEIAAAFAEAERHFGRIDVVFNNAGSGILGELESVPDEVARREMELNFWGALNVTKAAVRFFRKVNQPQGGLLLQNSSMMGLEGFPGGGYYSAAKFALIGMSESLAGELNPAWNIKVTVIEAGWHNTDIKRHTVQVPPLDAYQDANPVLAGMRAYFAASELDPPGDAAKATEVIYRLSTLPDPPTHFPLGKDSVAVFRKKSAALAALADKYASWSDNLLRT